MKFDRAKNRRGAALVFVAICTVVLIMVAALVVDIGKLYVAKQRAQNVCDAAAVAGAWKLNGASDGFDNATSAAQSVAAGNNSEVPGWPVSDVVVDFPGKYTLQDGYCTYTDKAIQVSCEAPVEYTFGRIFGKSGWSPPATAIAARVSAGSVTYTLAPWGLAEVAISGEDENIPLNPGDQATFNVVNPTDKPKIPSAYSLVCLTYNKSDAQPEAYIAQLKGTAQAVQIQVGSTISAYNQSGSVMGATQMALGARFAGDSNTFESWTRGGYPPTQRIVMVPVVQLSTSDRFNWTTTFTVKGFAGLFVESIDATAGTVTGRLVNGVATGKLLKWEIGSSGMISRNMVESIRLVK